MTEKTATVTARASVWLAALDSAASQADNGDSGRPILTGIAVTMYEGRIEVCGTNGVGMVQVTADALVEGEGEYVIAVDKTWHDPAPFKSLIAALKVAARDEKKGRHADVTISFGRTSARAIVGATEIALPIVEGSFPNYRPLIPAATATDAFNGRISISPDVLGGILAMASRYAVKGDDRAANRICRFYFTSATQPARIDWVGDGWSTIGLAMPLFVKWD